MDRHGSEQALASLTQPWGIGLEDGRSDEKRSEHIMQRRMFLKKVAGGTVGLATVAGLASYMGGCGAHVANNRLAKKVIVLGIDGMDPHLLSMFIDQGVMPHFRRFIERGDFRPLGTTLPPQSPVAWSTFISGMNPGGHGIFDFIHREPATLTPYFSASRTSPPSKTVHLGDWCIPLSGGNVELLRKGPAFWTFLEDRDIPATLFKIPVNFPPVDGRSRTLSGLGTPDVLGTYGTFSYYTDAPPRDAEQFTGGQVIPVKVVDHCIGTELRGPRNTFRRDREPIQVPFTMWRDPEYPVAKIALQGQEMMLRQGEWTGWIRVHFEVVPHLNSVSGICRFYLKEVHPHIRLYVSPIHIDPHDPVMPICTPKGYSKELSDAVGLFGTKGFPEDTKALSHGVLTDEEYLEQADAVLDERMRLFDYELNRFSEGLLFFYFSSIDQNCHMMWRTMDPRHPLYDPKASDRVKGAVQHFYMAMDAVLAQTLGKVGDRTTLIVLSDHGFVPFYREFHLNSWLVEQGYIALLDPSKQGEGALFENVDWARTKAYALGLNALYVNLRGREAHGSVSPSEVSALQDRLVAELEGYTDPETRASVVGHVYRREDVYTGPYVDQAPDLIVGYHPGYRISDTAALGTIPRAVMEDRKDKWSADHCMDPPEVPGVLLSNKRIVKADAGLEDMAPTILAEFGIEPPGEMVGRGVLEG